MLNKIDTSNGEENAYDRKVSSNIFLFSNSQFPKFFFITLLNS